MNLEIKKMVILLFLLLLYLQTIEADEITKISIDTIMFNSDKALNLVYSGDGYKEKERYKFKQDLIKINSALFCISPFKEYKEFFNVYGIFVVSKESGASHPCSASDCPDSTCHPVRFVNNIYGSSFDSDGIHRLLVPTNEENINKIISLSNIRNVQTIILVNTPYFGGSGDKFSAIATVSVNEETPTILAHELGHSIFDLADEYYPEIAITSEKYPNMTQISDPAKIKWKEWIGIERVGVYPCNRYELMTWYRPTQQECIMQELSQHFCPICRESIVIALYDYYGSPIRRIFPDNTKVIRYVSNSNMFGIELTKPQPNTLQTKWFFNGVLFDKNKDSVEINSDMLRFGENTLRVEVLDTTAFVRKVAFKSKHTYSQIWKIDK